MIFLVFYNRETIKVEKKINWFDLELFDKKRGDIILWLLEENLLLWDLIFV